jgi:hypothetical protein
MYCIGKKGNETKSVIFKQRTAKITQKLQKKLIKSQNPKKNLSLSFLMRACEHL